MPQVRLHLRLDLPDVPTRCANYAEFASLMRQIADEVEAGSASKGVCIMPCPTKTGRWEIEKVADTDTPKTPRRVQ